LSDFVLFLNGSVFTVLKQIIDVINFQKFQTLAAL